MKRRAQAESRDWTAEIIAAWRETIEGIFKTGDLLLEARESHAHGDWEKFTETLPFSYDTANRLCKIASSVFLRKVAPAQLLPTHYTILSELAALSPEQFDEALEAGAIRPDMQRWDATQLKKRRASSVLSAGSLSSPEKFLKGKFSSSKLPTDALGVARKRYLELCQSLSDAELERELHFCIDYFKQRIDSDEN